MKETHLSLTGAHTSADLQVFEHEMFGGLRVVVTNDQKTLFNLADVCRALEIKNPRQTKSRLSKRGVITTDTPTQNQFGAIVMQPMTYIDEPNLYRCIFQSRKEEAEKFQTWVFEEVLPQIRRTGGFIPTKDAQGRKLSNAEILQVAQMIVGRTLHMLNEPNEDCLTMTAVAESWGMDFKSFSQLLLRMGILRRKGRSWMLSPELEGKGLTRTRYFLYYALNGQQKSREYMVWTPEGISYLNSRFLAEPTPTPKVIQLNLFMDTKTYDYEKEK